MDLNPLEGYECPVQLIQRAVNKDVENMLMKSIHSVGVTVDKDELVRALNYDRDSYAKGYKEGYNKACDKIIGLVRKEFNL